MLIVAATLLGLVAVTGLGGYLYLRNSEWWVAITLFHDDYRADNFRTMHELFPSREVPAGGDVWELPLAKGGPVPLPETYQFDGEERSLVAFLEESETTGLLVLRDGMIIHESYYQGNDSASPAQSFSMAKSIVSALVGIAIQEGHIRSVRDPISDYVPELRGSGYDGVSIHDVLTMSSGVDFDENYDSFRSDIMWLPVRVFGFREAAPDILAELDRKREPGTYNEYISSDSIALGLLVARATGVPMAHYLSEKIWVPAGMERSAWWNTDYHGNELGHAFLGATVRDYGRVGLLYLNEGRRGDRPDDSGEIIPAGWIYDSVNPTEAHLQPGENPDSFWTFGYGYQWWIPEQPDGEFAAIGIWGQYIYVYPRFGTVIVKTSTDYDFDTRDHETIEVFRAIARRSLR
ncbi:MAG: class C beta-lactamase-related serine hydrolase [Spirochaetaceae bacterium]|nr:MAG: class C beta-lactamase-related serine hydrolase [Spirochaetaceae bacterium]